MVSMNIKRIRPITDMNANIFFSLSLENLQSKLTSSASVTYCNVIMSDFKDSKDNEVNGKEQEKTFDWLPGGHVALADGEYDAIIMVI